MKFYWKIVSLKFFPKLPILSFVYSHIAMQSTCITFCCSFHYQSTVRIYKVMHYKDTNNLRNKFQINPKWHFYACLHIHTLSQNYPLKNAIFAHLNINMIKDTFKKLLLDSSRAAANCRFPASIPRNRGCEVQ